MYPHTFSHRVINGSLTLPVTTVLTLVAWLVPDMGNGLLWAGLAMTGLATYLILELNNRNSLLRIRSRMISSTFLLLMAVCPMLHSFELYTLPTLCFLLSYYTLFASYQQHRAEGYIFHSFLFTGIGSLLFPPMLLLAFSYTFNMLFQLRNLRLRTLMAGLTGLLTPYWIMAAYGIWNNQLDTTFGYLTEWKNQVIPDYTILTSHEWVTAATILFFALLAFIHFFRTAYNDKIRTRIFYYIIATQEVVLVAGLLLLPQHFEQLLSLVVANSSFLIAHYYALAKGRFFHIWFNLSLLILIVLGIYNYLNL